MNSRMKTFPRVGLYLLPAVLAVLLASPPAAAAQPACDEWRFSLMPYLWLPTIDATLNLRTPFGNPEVNAKAHPGDYLSEVEMALMLVFEARKGKWLLFSDVTYMKSSNDSSSVRSLDFNPGLPPNPVNATLNSGTNTDIYATIWTVAGGYNLVQGPKASLDVIAGARADRSSRGRRRPGSATRSAGAISSWDTGIWRGSRTATRRSRISSSTDSAWAAYSTSDSEWRDEVPRRRPWHKATGVRTL